MILNHINLVVASVPKAVALFEKCFGFKCIENRKDALAVCTNEANFVLIFWSSKLNKTDTVSYPENFHIGFYQPDQEAVLRVYNKLKDQEVNLGSAPQKLRNTFGFYCHFENIMIEISVMPS
ncbi:VOC family protein [Arcticibacter sp. MXS-1]|uniref:VOC family protein n=1 Tax=Arcticibacter sp. MXS-1 TaxID=3341726 RepID=UPI0035A98CBF